jgi:PAS domain S-box-containing protein
MAGYRTTGRLAWDPSFVLASVVVGAGFAALALLAAPSGSRFRRQATGAALLSLGIVGMHFTGMTAVTILADSAVPVPHHLMSNASMVVAAVVVTGLILIIAMAGVGLDSATRNSHLKRLREALHVMPEGLAFYDATDRLVAWNAMYAELCSGSQTPLSVGQTFHEIMQESVAAGGVPEAVGREREWLAERAAARRGDRPGVIQQNSAGRWLRVTDRRTADGGIVTIAVDITELKRTEAAMAEALDRAAELVRRAEAAEAAAGLGRWRLDAATREITWSAQMYRNYALDPGEALDFEAVMSMTHPDDRAVAQARVEHQLSQGAADPGAVTRIVLPDGEIRYLAGRSDVELGADGELVALVGTATDVTAQKLAEIAIRTSEERFRRLAVNAPDMITEFQLDGTMTYVSPASLPITGFTPEELIGRRFTSLMDPEDGARVLAMCQAVYRSRGEVAPWKLEFRARHKAGHEIWLECKPTLAPDPVTGRFTCLNDVVRDITARKALEAQLRLAQAEAEAAADVKADFLANMSHELRTPLTSIIGFTGLAAEQTDLSDLTREYVDRVGNASRALLCTVNDILDFSKLEAGQVTIHREPASLAKLGRETLDLFTPQAGAKDLNLTWDAGPGEEDLVLAVDADRVRQILLNLLSNAVKFTTTGGVTLKVRYDVGSQILRVEVIDTGDGIAPAKQESLFKRFSQIDGSLTRTQSGTGLGLAICKGLAEAMGGKIGVNSREGEGSRFWFELPASLATLPGRQDAGEPLIQVSFGGVRVLVVDDNRTNRELVRLHLAAVGADVSEAANGEEGAQMAAKLPYELILMDVQMPILDGPGALRKIRGVRGPNDATPMFAFTADADPANKERLMSLGFDGVISKPMEPGALIAAITAATTADLREGAVAGDAGRRKATPFS